MADRRNTRKKTTHEGYLPPQAVDLEEAVLGAIMLEPIPNTVWPTIKTEYFYKQAHQLIFNAISLLRAERTPIDILTVKSKLQNLGDLEMAGGAWYITELTNKVASSSNIEYHIKVIHERYIKRSLIEIGTTTTTSMYEDTTDPFVQMDNVVKGINDLKLGIYKRTEKNMGQILLEAQEERFRPKRDGLLGITTGFEGLDYITQGDQENQLRIVAGRPAMGKTAYMCSEMLACVYDLNKQQFRPKEEQVPVGCFSLEMSGMQLGFRMLSNVSSVGSLKIKKNELTPTEEERVDLFQEKLSECPVYIDDTPGLTIDEFESKAAMLVAQHGVKKIYIDYLQLMKGTPGKKYQSREAEVSDISRRLKVCAKELKITIIALCQLSREVEKRPLCMPILSDLRESGSIEQDADVVQFLWRPEYYPAVIELLNKNGGEIDISLFGFKLTEFNGVVITIVAKCREEETGKIPMLFNGGLMRMKDHPRVLEFVGSKKTGVFIDPSKITDDAPF